MTSQEPDYLQAVEAHFVALRGQGYALTGRDVGRVLAWQAQGVPLRVVLQALDEEARRRGPGLGQAARPLTLGSFARGVHEKANRWAERRVTIAATGDARPAAERLALLTAELDAMEQRGLAPAIVAGARARLAGAGDDAWAVASELDALIAAELEASLDGDARAELSSRVAARLDPRASAEARADKAGFERAKELRARFGVPELLQVLLDAR